MNTCCNLHFLKSCQKQLQLRLIIYCSGTNMLPGTTGWGSVLQSPHEATRSSAGWWSSQEVLEMIALKELKTCRHGLHQNVEALRGRTVKLY
jgi:hypothetical protein